MKARRHPLGLQTPHALVDAPACEEDIARGDTAAVHEISEGRYSCTS
jgi:hypothetical protein